MVSGRPPAAQMTLRRLREARSGRSRPAPLSRARCWAGLRQAAWPESHLPEGAGPPPAHRPAAVRPTPFAHSPRCVPARPDAGICLNGRTVGLALGARGAAGRTLADALLAAPAARPPVRRSRPPGMPCPQLLPHGVCRGRLGQSGARRSRPVPEMHAGGSFRLRRRPKARARCRPERASRVFRVPGHAPPARPVPARRRPVHGTGILCIR